MSDFQQRLQVELPAPSQLFTPGVIGSLVLLIVGYAVMCYAPNFVVANLALSTQGVFSGKVWQLLTYPFMEPFVLNVIFGLWVIIFAGSAVERQWGTRGYLLLWLVVTVVCGLVWLLVSMALEQPWVGGGISVACYGLIGAFGLLYRHARFFMWICTIEGQWLALIMIGIGLVLCIPAPVTVVWVGGALVAYVYVQIRWRLQSGPKLRQPRAQKAGGGGGFVDID
ncbi:MAG TPA: rhomboid family intramembrane serine protease [Anaerohalosphaeraceae bacterium]|jgi:membrane associated rhomboid family serine protease|nr:rhomboid family intramembrane serine protease [Anaerohalosphaeraceae bacterium]HRT50487.1 rhomboid family intramembrane serine protease [Anaerohalosphaeraceae bacterium]HRT86417.1 rhomboid family intramembrane serine protease [Anaerohalosphaeraceae bacterium]